MEDITSAGYVHTKRICKDFERKKIDVTDVFENFQNLNLAIYELDFVHFLIAPGLALKN